MPLRVSLFIIFSAFKKNEESLHRSETLLMQYLCVEVILLGNPFDRIQTFFSYHFLWYHWIESEFLDTIAVFDMIR